MKIRVLIVDDSLFMRAANFLQGQKNVTAFFDDHGSARAWLLECREKHLAAETK